LAKTSSKNRRIIKKMIYKFDELSKVEKYKIMSQTIIPRPIAWVVTENKTINIAPFSYFTGISSEPATILISIGHKKNGEPKDTLKNLRETKKCVVCFVDEKYLEKMNSSSEELPADVSEAEKFDIPTKKIYNEFPPMIEDVNCAYFCELNQEVNIGGTTIPVILNVKEVFIKDEFITNKDRITIDLDVIARIGANYARIEKI
jgi:flavin reductase (DIM6/NTAB) family NADH-FMN oxidoreductase RutF